MYLARSTRSAYEAPTSYCPVWCITACLRLHRAGYPPVRCSTRYWASGNGFWLTDVRLLDGSPFKRAMDLNATYLLQLDADRLLHRWRTNAGLEAKTDLYGGWEGQSSGSSHMLGHYLSVMSLSAAGSAVGGRGDECTPAP